MDRIRVLIADDEESVRESLTSVVESDPTLEVIGTAPDAEAAIDLAAARRPDVALVDVRMPGGGPRAAREISMRCPPTRVVALSAFEDRTTVLSMIRAGARSYVGKGASNEEILKAIHGTVDGNTELTPQAMNEVFTAFAEAVEDGAPRTSADRTRERLDRIIRRKAVDFVFQPVAALRGMRVVSVEAFARFRTLPRRPPQAWFADATSTGRLRELELVTIGRALPHLHRLPPGCSLSLNVFPETAASRKFLELVSATAPERIIVELNERASAADGIDPLNEALGELRARGVRVALDDAGTAFTSLRHAVRLAPDLIKLDMSLTRDIASDPTKQALLSSLLSFAFDVGAAVVAKGVETERELLTLQDLGVPQAQGYFLARPGPIPEVGDEWGRTQFGAPSDTGLPA